MTPSTKAKLKNDLKIVEDQIRRCPDPSDKVVLRQTRHRMLAQIGETGHTYLGGKDYHNAVRTNRGTWTGN
jgi:hypothetical protein